MIKFSCMFLIIRVSFRGIDGVEKCSPIEWCFLENYRQIASYHV
jgi:hypothetical protein